MASPPRPPPVAEVAIEAPAPVAVKRPHSPSTPPQRHTLEQSAPDTAALESDAKRRKTNDADAVQSKKKHIGNKGEVTVVNADALEKEEQGFLGTAPYAPGLLLPPFDSSHLFKTIDVRVSAPHLSFARNPQVANRAVWGTGVYTDDSDVVAAVLHAGFY
ncbi:hypothetical protein HDU98_002581, partial [Podochytrium sp. JEL0797]